ncbi:YdcF family protein [Paractinoplanes ferrugineus]|uniref:YdcF family protein n=1 Tax=Paractinoplanes ferrugineus TaxID=113564 RepID=UPI001EF3A230|nr:YdcF family protein [Actinoplanes ferrugineus]
MSDANWSAAHRLWRYHRLEQPLRACDAAIVCGSHDLAIATCAADLYQAGWFPLVVFSGAGNPVRPEDFPDGEAVRLRHLAVAAGVPLSATLLEPDATNTGENITLSRDVLAAAGVHPRSVMLICRPFDQRRAFATCRKLWPAVDPVCASQTIEFDDYLALAGDDRLVIDILVGDLQRIIEYPARGYAISQPVPADVHDAYEQLRAAGFTSRLLPEPV